MILTDAYSPAPSQAPQTKRVYDWTYHRYITLIVLPDEPRRIPAPATKFDDPEWRPAKTGRPDVSMAKVAAWLRNHGPATARDIGDGLKMSRDTIQGVLARGKGKFTFKTSCTTCGNGAVRPVRVWEVAE